VKRAPLDLLFVVDNSGSMLDEQNALARSIFDPRCPISDVGNVPLDLQEPSREVFDELSDVCGIAQLIAAMGGDFRIAVITTDVGACDERLPAGQDPDGLHEPTLMRGCAQGGIITRNDDVEAALQTAMLGVGTYGSSRERGLDAMHAFLAPDGKTAPGCEQDGDDFLRPDGRLVVVFVADEDDCSHQDGAFGFPNELAGEPEGCGDFPELFTNPDARPALCVEQADRLAPVSFYRDTLRALVDEGRTTDVIVSVVGGLRETGNGLVAGDCIAREDGSFDGLCSPVLGAGNSCTEDEQCCSADGAHRYVEFARTVNADSLMGSICAPDFRAPLMPLFLVGELGGEEVF